MRTRSAGSIIAVALGAALALSGCAPAGGAPGDAARDGAAQPPSSATPQPVPEGSGEDAKNSEKPGQPDGTGSPTPRDADLTATVFGATWEDVVASAGKRFDGEPVSVSFEWKGGAFTYTVKLLTSDELYLADFDADSGEFLGEWTKQRGGGGRAWTPSDVFAGAEVIEPSAAIAAALAAVPGTFEEWELESNDGGLRYEVQIDRGGDDADVILDARTGDIVEIDN